MEKHLEDDIMDNSSLEHPNVANVSINKRYIELGRFGIIGNMIEVAEEELGTKDITIVSSNIDPISKEFHLIFQRKADQ